MDVLDEALALASGQRGPFTRAQEHTIYERILCGQFEDPDTILAHAGTWADDRVTSGT